MAMMHERDLFAHIAQRARMYERDSSGAGPRDPDAMHERNQLHKQMNMFFASGREKHIQMLSACVAAA